MRKKIGHLSSKIESAKPTDEQVSSAVSAWLEANPEATTTVADGSIDEPKLSQDVKDRLVPNKSTLTAYEAGAVKPFKRYDTIYDDIVPMMNTKYFQNCKTVEISPEQTDGVNNVIHESTIVGTANDRVLLVVYMENMTGTTTDYEIKNGDTRVRARYLYQRYGPFEDYEPYYVGDPVDVMYQGISLSDGNSALGGFGGCTAFTCGGRVYIIAGGYKSETEHRFFVSYMDVSTDSINDATSLPAMEWSAPQVLNLSANGETTEYTPEALATACGLDSAIIQPNNQVWVQGTKFYTAVSIRYKGVAVLLSTDGITWEFKAFFQTDYKCKFICEAACGMHVDSRMWIACRNDNGSTTTIDKDFTNYLTIIKVNTSNWTKVAEYNIPDCGCKPFFVAPGHLSYVQHTTSKPIVLMHNPYTREAAELIMLADFPICSLGEIRGGANYITAYCNLSSGALKYMVTCGTNDLVTERKGALVRRGIWIAKRENMDTALTEWKNSPYEVERIEFAATSAWKSLIPGKFYYFSGTSEYVNWNLGVPSSNAVRNEYKFMFNSGATPTKLVIPTGVVVPDGFAVEANKTYEITVCEGLLSYKSWPYTE